MLPHRLVNKLIGRSFLIIIFIISICCNIKLYFKEQAAEGVSSTARPLSPFMQKLLDSTRSKIQYELASYNFSSSDAYGLEDLVMESGGKPLQSMVISTWKSGSTFLGQLINSVPGSFYHYEPLSSYGFRRIRSRPEANQTLTIIKNLLKCNYVGLKDYFRYGKKNVDLFSHNRRLWEHCETSKRLCEDARFMSLMCKLFPFQVMKIVRLRLRLIPKILDDEKLNVRVILLVRDPRGVMQFRQHRNSCFNTPECLTAPVVCSDMISDFVAAGLIMQMYPGKLMVVRYEELILDPVVIAHRIFVFLKLSDTESLDHFMQRYKELEEKDLDISSEKSVFSDGPFTWQKTMNFSDIHDVQMACEEAMLLWGYRMAYNESHLKSKDFNPIADISTLNWSKTVNST